MRSLPTALLPVPDVPCHRLPSVSEHSFVSVQLVHGASCCELGTQLSGLLSHSLPIRKLSSPKVPLLLPRSFSLARLRLQKNPFLMVLVGLRGGLRSDTQPALFAQEAPAGPSNLILGCSFGREAECCRPVLKRLPRHYLVHDSVLDQPCAIQQKLSNTFIDIIISCVTTGVTFPSDAFLQHVATPSSLSCTWSEGSPLLRAG